MINLNVIKIASGEEKSKYHLASHDMQSKLQGSVLNLSPSQFLQMALCESSSRYRSHGNSFTVMTTLLPVRWGPTKNVVWDHHITVWRQRERSVVDLMASAFHKCFLSRTALIIQDKKK